MTSFIVVTEQAVSLLRERSGWQNRKRMPDLPGYVFFFLNSSAEGGRRGWVRWLAVWEGGRALWLQFEKSSGGGFEPDNGTACFSN